MINKIINLTKYSLIDLYQKNEFLKNKNKKLFFTIVAIAITYLSYTIIDYFNKIGQNELFLNIYFFIMFMLVTFQTIIICTNIFFDSKDIVALLPLPIKPMEIFASKYITILGVLYFSEILYGLIPLTLYGIISECGLYYYLNALISLIVFPIFVCSIWTSTMLLLMKMLRFIKNKNILTFILVSLMLLIIFFGFLIIAIYTMNGKGNFIVNKIININNYIIIINPIVNLLAMKSELNILIYLTETIILSLFSILLVFWIGSKTYYNNLLIHLSKSTNQYNDDFDFQNHIKVKNSKKAYILKEIKQIFSNPMYIIQFVILQSIYIILAVILINIMTPMIIKESGQISMSIEFFGIILCISQLLFGMSNIAVTAFSREGVNAKFMKYIPIEFKKQFRYKKRPQIYMNTIASIGVISGFKMIEPSFGIIEIIIIFIISNLLNNLFTTLVLIADLKKPNLKWDSEAILIKSNENQTYQYFLIIVFELIIMYIMNVCQGINYYQYLLINLIILISTNIILELLIKKNINKWFININ